MCGQKNSRRKKRDKRAETWPKTNDSENPIYSGLSYNYSHSSQLPVLRENIRETVISTIIRKVSIFFFKFLFVDKNLIQKNHMDLKFQ